MFEAPALSPLTNVKMRFFGSVIVDGAKREKLSKDGKKERKRRKNKNRSTTMDRALWSLKKREWRRLRRSEKIKFSFTSLFLNSHPNGKTTKKALPHLPCVLSPFL